MGKLDFLNFSFKKLISVFAILGTLSFVLSGCGASGEKNTSLHVFYIITAIFSFVLLLSYFFIAKKKLLWYIMLYVSIFVVNIGYLCLSISNSLEEALLANRISYLGSVFLPLSMFMIILTVSNIKYKKLLPLILSLLSVGVFIIAASPGYSDIYYKTVELVNVNGVSVLEKTYGPLHIIYLIYLLSYFICMLSAIIYSVIKRKNNSHIYPCILILTVFVNIGIWLIEQFVKIDFELLSVSYIISGMFMLCLNLIVKDEQVRIIEHQNTETTSSNLFDETPVTDENDSVEKPSDGIVWDLTQLTKTERKIFDYYIQGKSTKEVMAELNITENTLKYHNKNIYGKLGVSSRKQLIEISKR